MNVEIIEPERNEIEIAIKIEVAHRGKVWRQYGRDNARKTPEGAASVPEGQRCTTEHTCVPCGQQVWDPIIVEIP
jgi:hypothetical protein